MYPSVPINMANIRGVVAGFMMFAGKRHAIMLSSLPQVFIPADFVRLSFLKLYSMPRNVNSSGDMLAIACHCSSSDFPM